MGVGRRGRANRHISPVSCLQPSSSRKMRLASTCRGDRCRHLGASTPKDRRAEVQLLQHPTTSSEGALLIYNSAMLLGNVESSNRKV
jgi:hypothetical protein